MNHPSNSSPWAHRVYCLGVWTALPLAVFTCNGLLGLLAHWVAFAGAAWWLDEQRSRPLPELRASETFKG